jgi:hypothetical protein
MFKPPVARMRIAFFAPLAFLAPNTVKIRYEGPVFSTTLETHRAVNGEEAEPGSIITSIEDRISDALRPAVKGITDATLDPAELTTAPKFEINPPS